MTDTPTPSKPLICLENMSAAYGAYTALKNIQGRFTQGSLTAVIGPNGGGKTTLLRVLNRQLKPKEGTITFMHESAQQIAYMPQKIKIDTSFPITVKEVAGMGLMTSRPSHGAYTPQDLYAIESALESVGLSQKSRQLIGTLSGGQLQRLLFARLMLQDQPIIILDEPFASIDQATQALLLDMIKKWHQDGRTIIVVMHDLDLVQKHFPETLLIARQMVAWGETADVTSEKNLSKAFHLLLEAS